MNSIADLIDFFFSVTQEQELSDTLICFLVCVCEEEDDTYNVCVHTLGKYDWIYIYTHK